MLVARERFDYQELPVRENRRQSRIYRVHKVGARTKVAYGALLLLALSLAFMVTSRYAQIASVGYEIVALKKQVQDLDTENQVLANKVAELDSLQNIEYVATTRLGMQKPELAEGVQFVPVEYSKAGSGDEGVGVAENDSAGARETPKTAEKTNYFVQALAKIING